MPNTNFIKVKPMHGELLIYQKQNQLGYTLTTQELIFQNPHASYQILLSDILGIVPFRLQRDPAMLELLTETGARPSFPKQYYRISARRVVVINRRGHYERGTTDILIPLNDRFIQHIEAHADFASIPIS
ncbi:hypothetical protein SAMN05444487_12136 [Marininema mesophilum]|uniref:Uncharacterized protein n=1 Tax=Marininema mesophilum TaxID=1048340 RepID=A0A1H3CC78_9BACL|nr:hypothetical protein [Marininema mesophilum]SDX51706.1 hypothetical protein SAMN05444487_12136 [Marininema mesophilum]